ncbi:adenylate cyclase type 5-like [Macrosteles quadrilineatus]|uniref:adenylate cyclase type 5-like n=1 Tax=Macrosteles quadrilineatus TaxID=74068 RepID=UPI0023E30233|nr:adenylate cyclase type 5-like [Macrosteles quadrilineatus]
MAKRKAFSEIRQYVRTKITVQKETVRQQNLLLSVLPEHLIEEMKTDLARLSGTISKRKIYIKTYEPVSILFADIVGFTSLADRSAGSFVVELLNDLYCSFDKLARKNRCMRIKLLGDCYYCVCGLPKPDNFHASCCVDMGLDMIYVMHEVRKKYDIDVDIRVGVHTGKLQCGVLGLKKWQFDIWGSDVETANNMESGGVPGKVHISEATKNHLLATSDNYMTQPAYGFTRESSLKEIETFFVSPSYAGKVKVEQNVSRHNQDYSNGPSKTSAVEGNASLPLFNPIKRQRDIERELIATLYNSINARSFRRLKKTNCKSTGLRFKDKQMEKKYNQEPDRMLQSYFLTSLVVFLSIMVVQLIVMPRTFKLLVCCGLGLLWFVFVCCLVMAWNYTNSKCIPSCVATASSKIDRSRSVAQTLALVTVIISYIVITIPMVSEDSYFCRTLLDIEQAEERSLTPIRYIQKNPLNETCAAKTLPYPEHTLLYTILMMIMTGAFQIVMFRVKFMIMLGLCTAYTVLLITAPYFMELVVDTEAAIKYFLMIMALTSFLLLMLIQSQQSEIVHRLDFIWKINARSDSENIQQLQKFNTKLIENILPAHVAKHYLKMDRLQDEQYHEECLSTCILFASITRFSFTNIDGEDSERNVAILHDIISDIDELLNEPLFSSIEKIKSTGAIYMAASGLSLTQENANSHDHILAMAYFALTLLDQIHQINIRHDTSFGVKIGISMGSVVAGVIGASMPQYDIWGNTVNVASRMYSTGLENHIQVTENFAAVAEKNGFTVRKRGEVFVKGKGSMVTYFLVNGPDIEDAIQRARDLRRPRSSVGLRASQGSRTSWKHSRSEGRSSTENTTRGSKLSKLFKGLYSPKGSVDSGKLSNAASSSILPNNSTRLSEMSDHENTSQPSSSKNSNFAHLSVDPTTKSNKEVQLRGSIAGVPKSKNKISKGDEDEPLKITDINKPQATVYNNSANENSLSQHDNTAQSSKTNHRVSFSLDNEIPSSLTDSRNSEDEANKSFNNSPKRKISKFRKSNSKHQTGNINNSMEEKSLEFWKKQEAARKRILETTNMKRVSFSEGNEIDNTQSSLQHSENIQEFHPENDTSRHPRRRGSINRVSFSMEDEEIPISPRASDNRQNSKNLSRRMKFWKKKDLGTGPRIEPDPLHTNQEPPSESTEDSQSQENSDESSSSFCNWIWSSLTKHFSNR